MKKSALSFITLIACSSIVAIAQDAITFSKRYNIHPKNPENGWSAIESSDGYFLLGPGGCTYDYTKGCTNLIKIDFHGDTMWHKQFDFYPGSTDCIHLWKDSLIYIASLTHAEDTLDKQQQVHCYDKNGNLLWDKTWGDSSIWELGGFLLVTRQHSIFQAYNKKPKQQLPGADSRGFVGLTKMDSLGQCLFEVEFRDGWEYTVSPNILEYSDGDLAVNFRVRDSTIGPGAIKSVLVKLGPDGSRSWATSVQAEGLVFPSPRMALLHDDTAILAWQEENDISGEIAPSLHFVNTEGDPFQKYIFTTADRAIRELNFLATAPNGDLLGGGYGWLGEDSVFGEWGGWLFRMSPAGELRWERNYLTRIGPNQEENPFTSLVNVVGTSDGGVLAIGRADNLLPTGEYETDMWVLKLDSLGCLQPDCGLRTVLLPAGEPQPADTAPPMLELYPNPASTRVTVVLPADVSGPKQILVADALGRLILQKTVDFNAGQAQLSVADLPPGVYALTVGDAKGARASAMLVVKK